MWLHIKPSILKQGRVKHSDPPAEEGLEPEDLMKREIEKDPWEAMLKPIENDSKTRGGMPAWIIRSYNSKDDFANPNPKPGQPPVNYGTVVVKSLWWPGSFTFYNNSQTFQVYSGDGQKHEPLNAKYYPVLPPVMMDDRDEKVCYDEPNPTEEWLSKRAALEAKN